MLKVFLISLLVLCGFCSNAQVYTIGSATYTSSYYGFSSINTLYEDSRVQYIYSASELQTAGVPSGLEIDAFQLFVYELPGVEMSNFTISMKNTGTSSYPSSPAYDSGLTTVYSTSSIGPADFTAGDWKQFQLQTPFVWDGVSNLLVQICYDNPDGAAVLDAGGIYVYQDPDDQNRTAFRYANLASGCSLTGGNRTRYKANIRLEKNCTVPDNSYTVVHSPSICSGNAEMSLSGSEVGVNYKLYDWSGTQIGSAISGTGSLIDLPAITSTEVYYVNAEGTGSICLGPYTMKDGNDFHLISMNATTDPSDVDAGLSATICEGNTHQLAGSSTVSSVILYSEDFESTFKVNTYNGGDNSGDDTYESWYWSSGAYASGTNYARVNSFQYGSFDMDEALISPEFDASNMSALTLAFDHNLDVWTTELASIDVWNGSSWNTVASYTTDQGDNSTPSPSSVSLDISAYKNARMKVRFRYYNANYENWWIVDNIVISGTPSTNYSWDNASSLTNAAISNPVANSTSNTTYTMAVTANGCVSTDQVTISVEAPPSVTSASLTDATTCGVNTYDATLSHPLASGEWSVSPESAVLFDNIFDPNTSVIANPIAGAFNTDLTLSWTENSGVCAGSTDNVIVKFNQPVESISKDTDTWIWGGLTDTDWTTPSNWYKWGGLKWDIQNSGTPDGNSKVHVLSNGNAGVCVSASNIGVVTSSMTSLNVGDGGTVNFGSQSFNISGDITNNNGTIVAGSATVTLNGTSPQTISGAGSPTTDFNTLIINNSNGVMMDIPVTVKETLTMTSGNISNGSNILTIGTSSANSGTLNHTSGIVIGKLRRYFTNAATSGTDGYFPIGDASSLFEARVYFTSAPGADQYLTASYNLGVPMDGSATLWNGLPLITGDGELIDNYGEHGHWEINPTNDDYNSLINSAEYMLSIRMKNLSGVEDYSRVRIIKSAGSNTSSEHHTSWSAPTFVSASGANSNFETSITSSGFSFFGSGGGGGGDLPVELISFSGSCTDGVVDLTWQTASEYNSSHFDVGHSRDGLTWIIANTQPAAGNSTKLLTYGYSDEGALGGDNYYRLTQVDIDGIEKTYDAINVSCINNGVNQFAVYPNPSTGTFQIVIKNTQLIGAAELKILDAFGSSVLQKTIEIGNGINTFMISKGDIAPGIYYIVLIDKSAKRQMLKHVIQ